MRKRILNLIRKLANGEELYTTDSPRITQAEIDEIEKRVDLLQVESIYGAEVGSPRLVYPLFPERFKMKAKELGDV